MPSWPFEVMFILLFGEKNNLSSSGSTKEKVNITCSEVRGVRIPCSREAILSSGNVRVQVFQAPGNSWVASPAVPSGSRIGCLEATLAPNGRTLAGPVCSGLSCVLNYNPAFSVERSVIILFIPKPHPV